MREGSLPRSESRGTQRVSAWRRAGAREAVTVHEAEASSDHGGADHEEAGTQEGKIGRRPLKQVRRCGSILARTKTLKTIKGAMPTILGNGRRAPGSPHLGWGTRNPGEQRQEGTSVVTSHRGFARGTNP